MAGKEFYLVYIPRIREDTFIHLNVEGDTWKLRGYPTPDGPYEVISQTAKSNTKNVIELSEHPRVKQFPYDHSSRGGESINNNRYWHDEIARRNREHGL
ncbi:hypothetical protein [Leifsonia sp. Leaf264]|uniref:hypothetical protein n=1 Tax=Leifsonia sp. Leaf264 TaxID=1736314 RepID=UPI0006F446E5|nr:hypothetical protein [Leifsonia sp. Leaf264]KQO98525.1 hypothetical protein ASF30_10715 [Leifsonia sp. Leaf264]